jgi:hypothetical protein
MGTSVPICALAKTPESAVSPKSGGSGLLHLTRSPNGFLDPITRVVQTAFDHAAGLEPENVIGAWCVVPRHHEHSAWPQIRHCSSP